LYEIARVQIRGYSLYADWDTDPAFPKGFESGFGSSGSKCSILKQTNF
jgi:hypothetical protein